MTDETVPVSPGQYDALLDVIIKHGEGSGLSPTVCAQMLIDIGTYLLVFNAGLDQAVLNAITSSIRRGLKLAVSASEVNVEVEEVDKETLH